MNQIESRAAAEMTLDMRSADKQDAAKFNSEIVSLNSEYNVFRSKPQLIAR